MAMATSRRSSGVGAATRALIGAQGSAAEPHVQALARAQAPLRDLSDAVHLLCVIHGAFPGLVDHAAAWVADEAMPGWSHDAAAYAAQERAQLARLTAAVGPIPSTPGQAASEAAVSGQRHALEMLARSDRVGCAAGTAFAFVLDWTAVRMVLDRTAERLGIAVDHGFAHFAGTTQALLDELQVSARVERAMIFGAQQMLVQQRGLWRLLESRAAARDALTG